LPRPSGPSRVLTLRMALPATGAPSSRSQIGRKIQLFTALRELERRRWEAMEEDNTEAVRDLTAEIESLQQAIELASVESEAPAISPYQARTRSAARSAGHTRGSSHAGGRLHLPLRPEARRASTTSRSEMFDDDRSSAGESNVSLSPRASHLSSWGREPRSPASPALPWGEGSSPSRVTPGRQRPSRGGGRPFARSSDNTAAGLPTFGIGGSPQGAAAADEASEDELLNSGLNTPPEEGEAFSPSMIECEADLSTQQEEGDAGTFACGSSVSTLTSPRTLLEESLHYQLDARVVRTPPRHSVARPLVRRAMAQAPVEACPRGKAAPSAATAQRPQQPPPAEQASRISSPSRGSPSKGRKSHSWQGSAEGQGAEAAGLPSTEEEREMEAALAAAAPARAAPLDAEPAPPKAEALYPLFGERMTRCIYSDSCGLREAALQKLAQDLQSGTQEEEDLDRLVGGVATVLQHSFQDSSSQVFLASASLLQAACERLAQRLPSAGAAEASAFGARLGRGT